MRKCPQILETDTRVEWRGQYMLEEGLEFGGMKPDAHLEEPHG